MSSRLMIAITGVFENPWVLVVSVPVVGCFVHLVATTGFGCWFRVWLVRRNCSFVGFGCGDANSCTVVWMYDINGEHNNR